MRGSPSHVKQPEDALFIKLVRRGAVALLVATLGFSAAGPAAAATIGAPRQAASAELSGDDPPPQQVKRACFTLLRFITQEVDDMNHANADMQQAVATGDWEGYLEASAEFDESLQDYEVYGRFYGNLNCEPLIGEAMPPAPPKWTS